MSEKLYTQVEVDALLNLAIGRIDAMEAGVTEIVGLVWGVTQNNMERVSYQFKACRELLGEDFKAFVPPAVENPPAPNGTGEERQIAETTLVEIERHQRALIETQRREKANLAIKIKELEQLTEQMRDNYWTLSRRLKYFAERFCMDETFAGAISFIVSESNAEWTASRRIDPSDSEIPF